MALGNEASTEPWIANWPLANSPDATNNGGRWRAEAATAAVADLCSIDPLRRRHYRTGGTAKGVHESVRCRFVKQDRENDSSHGFNPKDRSKRSAFTLEKLRSHLELEMALPSI